MKASVALLCLLWAAVHLDAQQPGRTLRFDDTVHDFGVIREKDGPVWHLFRFRNVSGKTLSIEDVLSSCGCMVPEYDKGPVAPGDSGFLKVYFDPRGRTERFHKSVRVVTDGGKSVISLFLKGSVILDSPPEENMYEIADGLYAGHLVVSLGTLQHGTAFAGDDIALYNSGDRTIWLRTAVDDVSGCIEVNHPDRISPGEMIQLQVSVNDIPDYYGSLQSRIWLLVDDVPASRHIDISGWLVDDLRGVADGEAPVCVLRNAYYNFGEVLCGASLERRVTVANGGKSPLVIRKIECPFPVEAEYVPGTVLAPGESAEIILSVGSSSPADLDAIVTVVSNDAASPVKRFRVEGKIIP